MVLVPVLLAFCFFNTISSVVFLKQNCIIPIQDLNDPVFYITEFLDNIFNCICLYLNQYHTYSAAISLIYHRTPHSCIGAVIVFNGPGIDLGSNPHDSICLVDAPVPLFLPKILFLECNIMRLKVKTIISQYI